jgi:hypothetical protein
MKSFSELGIQSNKNYFVGDKVKIMKVLNREIIIQNYKIEKSQYPKNKSGNVLTLQIEINNEKMIIFTGSDFIMQQIVQVSEEDLPFATTIVKIGEHFELT